MTDHAIVVPTRRGPVGAVVSEPEGERRGVIVLLQGTGPPCRAGVNAVWTRTARELAAIGLVVLRFDFACEGESTAAGRDVPRGSAWRRSADTGILRELAPWFLERTGESELLVAGACHGARVAFEFAATEPATSGLFLLVPYLGDQEPLYRAAGEDDEVPPFLDGDLWAGGSTMDTDDDVVGGFRACLSRGPVWLLLGEEEVEQALPFQNRLAGAPRPLELETVPGMAELHPITTPGQQDAARRRLVDRVAGVLSEREGMTLPT